MRDESQEEEGLGVVGIELEDFAEEGFGLRELLILQGLEGGIESLGDIEWRHGGDCSGARENSECNDRTRSVSEDRGDRRSTGLSAYLAQSLANATGSVFAGAA
jgi:hypothetical protein